VACHVIVLPLAQQADYEIAFELSVENLREEVKIGNEGGLENDGNVRSVEKLNRVGLLISFHLSAGYSNLNSESLYIMN